MLGLECFKRSPTSESKSILAWIGCILSDDRMLLTFRLRAVRRIGRKSYYTGGAIMRRIGYPLSPPSLRQAELPVAIIP